MTARAPAEIIDDMLARTRRIAVVGLSDQPSRASHGVAAVLQRRGWELVPVNPNVDEVLGVPAVDSLADIDGHVDLVDVFRRTEFLGLTWPGPRWRSVPVASGCSWAFAVRRPATSRAPPTCPTSRTTASRSK